MSTYERVKQHLDLSRSNAMNRSHAEQIREAKNVAVLSHSKAELEKMLREARR
ncbi:hypothetical protein [Sulfuricurvum sp.]|uniref:hypothetical protein n=1 Tax=Sulfuricurvum sp. TaxID=2025608 RepID=UPI002D712C96|nr:hypothetical protein [Sulfuricurvum sp.]HZF69385.1 hypothetical protein [Sulfuricurvum sp.]